MRARGAAALVAGGGLSPSGAQPYGPPYGMYTYDSWFPDFEVPTAHCHSGCAQWSDVAGDGHTGVTQAHVDKKWRSREAQVAAGRSCAMALADEVYTATYWCYCRDSSTWDYCRSPSDRGYPEQINLQIAGGDQVVVAWVTHHPSSAAPLAELSEHKDMRRARREEGITIHYTDPGSERREYSMHFVRFTRLGGNVEYHYRVRCGHSSCPWSDTLAFHSLPTDGTTRFAVFGDMGLYAWSNMDRLLKTGSGAAKQHDFIILLGDHAYNLASNQGLRGDGYMNAFQPVISTQPWVPVIGNHEWYDGDEFRRYIDQTHGLTMGGAVPHNVDNPVHTLLSVGTAFGVGANANASARRVPSGTSKWFSFDQGLAHIVALDLTPWYNFIPSDKAPQMAWLRADLAAAAANRGNVPWIIVMSHYPFYCTGCHGYQFSSEAAEEHGMAWEAQKRRDANWTNVSVGAYPDESIRDIIPVFDEFGVDLYIAGHWHYYEALWPAATGPASCMTCATPLQRDFVDPRVTVHVTTGNGGPPGLDGFEYSCPNGPDCRDIPATRAQSVEFGYGVIDVESATRLHYRQIRNRDGGVDDHFTIEQRTHAPFRRAAAGR